MPPKSLFPKPVFPIHHPAIKKPPNLQTPNINNLLGTHWDLQQQTPANVTETSPNNYAKSSIFKPSPWLPINSFSPGTRRRDSFKFAERNSLNSCLLTFMICLHLQEGELHPQDSVWRPGCVSFGRAPSRFILRTGTNLLCQLLNNNTPVRKLGLGAAEEPGGRLNYFGVTR